MTFSYPSFLKTADGAYLPTHTVLVDPALRRRLTVSDQRRFDQIAEKVDPAKLRTPGD